MYNTFSLTMSSGHCICGIIVLTRLKAVSVDSVVDGGGHGDVLDQGVGVILGGHHAPGASHVIDHTSAVVAG